MTDPSSTTAHPMTAPPAGVSGADPAPAILKSDVPAHDGARLRAQITRSLKPGKKGKASTPAKTKDKRVEDALTAWGGLSGNMDPIEAMITAQLVVTHELTMTTIADAFACRDGSRIQLSNDINNVCKMTRANLQQIETLARYRTWRRRSEAEHQQESPS